MKIFTVHEPPYPSEDPINKAVSLVFIKYGFSWGAFLLSPFYFFLKSQWLGLFFYILFLYLLFESLTFFKFDKEILSIYLIILHLFFGFEASSLQRIWLKLWGWREIASVTGYNKDECERNYFYKIFEDKHSDAYSGT